jgi:heat shock protein HspQ
VIAQPLTNLLKHKNFKQTDKSQHAFDELKIAMTRTPVLALPNFQEPFQVETDACAEGIGAVLMQKGQPIAFLSKALGEKHKHLSIYEKEFLTLNMAVERWRPYLQRQEFTILTDHRSLAYLSEQNLHSDMQRKSMTRLMGLQFKIVYNRSLAYLSEQNLHSDMQRKSMTRLMGLQFKIVYRKARDNVAANALSRVAHPSALQSVSMVKPDWIQEVLNSYTTDPRAQQLLSELALSSPNSAGYSLDNGLIRYKSHIWIGQNSALQTRLINVFHSSAISGHSGTKVTYQRLKNHFVWKGMKHAVEEYIKQCPICQQAKHTNTAPAGLLQPLPIPKGVWRDLSMDFIEGLPKSQGYSVILVVVDRLTMYAHFIVVKHPHTASTVAQLFMDNIVKLYGLPQSIVTDRDIFL